MGPIGAKLKKMGTQGAKKGKTFSRMVTILGMVIILWIVTFIEKVTVLWIVTILGMVTMLVMVTIIWDGDHHRGL